MRFTEHAQQRLRQRGVRTQQVLWLMEFGDRVWNRGAQVFYFTNASFASLIGEVTRNEHQLAEKARGLYAVISDGLVITVGHRERCFRVSKPKHVGANRLITPSRPWLA